MVAHRVWCEEGGGGRQINALRDSNWELTASRVSE